jgi:hypothetical protein
VVRYPAVLLVLLSAGCASVTPPQPQVAATQPAAPTPAATKPAAGAVPAATPEPVSSQPVASQPVASQPVVSQPVASQPVASQPAATPVATSAPQPARAAVTPPRVRTPVPQPVIRDAAPIAPPVAASRAAAAAPPLDLDALKARLRATKAIGVFTKISLKNKVDDLMKQFTGHYQGSKPTLAELRLSYDLLMMKVLSLLQDSDQALASEVVSSREAIWALLADEKKFFALQG